MGRQVTDDGEVVERMDVSDLKWNATRIEVLYQGLPLCRMVRRNFESMRYSPNMYLWDVRFTKRFKKLGLHDLLGLVSVKSAQRALLTHIDGRILEIHPDAWPSKHATSFKGENQ